MRSLILAATLTAAGFVAPAQAQNIAPQNSLGTPVPHISLASQIYSARSTEVVPALPSEIRVRAALRDRDGQYIGWVDKIREEGVVVRYGSGRRALLPFEAFGIEPMGLRLSITRAQFRDRAMARPYSD